MATALTVLNGTSVSEGGLGIDFGSKLFTLKPATLNIIQQNSNVEGKKGYLRVSETGDVFESMDVVLLAMPKEQRSYYTGEAGTMSRTPDNLLCFSRDMIRPDDHAKQPQAPLCNGCPQGDWKPWRDFKEANGISNKALIPGCDVFYYAVVVDTKYKLPMQMFIRTKSKQPFEKGMDNLARTFKMAKAQGKNPNIFDIRFTLKSKQITTGKFLSFVYDLSNFTYVTPEEREAFGEIYAEYTQQVNSREHRAIEASTEDNEDGSAAYTPEPLITNTQEINV